MSAGRAAGNGACGRPGPRGGRGRGSGGRRAATPEAGGGARPGPGGGAGRPGGAGPRWRAALRAPAGTRPGPNGGPEGRLRCGCWNRGGGGRKEAFARGRSGAFRRRPRGVRVHANGAGTPRCGDGIFSHARLAVTACARGACYTRIARGALGDRAPPQSRRGRARAFRLRGSPVSLFARSAVRLRTLRGCGTEPPAGERAVSCAPGPLCAERARGSSWDLKVYW